MSEHYFSIYIQCVLLISFGIYYFSFKDKDKFLITMLSFMFLILSYPYIKNPKYLMRDLGVKNKPVTKYKSSAEEKIEITGNDIIEAYENKGYVVMGVVDRGSHWEVQTFNRGLQKDYIRKENY